MKSLLLDTFKKFKKLTKRKKKKRNQKRLKSLLKKNQKVSIILCKVLHLTKTQRRKISTLKMTTAYLKK
jgi:hypothetical protein